MTTIDPIMQSLIKKYPAPHFSDRSAQLFENLIESIISQQLSIKAADTIYSRFVALFNPAGNQAAMVNKSPESYPELVLESRIPDPAGNNKKNIILARETRPESDHEQPHITFPTPQQILEKSDEELRSAGISYQKVSYIKSIADAFLSNLIDTKKMKHMPDDEVIQTLTQMRGVGKWTAEMILIFTLNRPDVFSVGDLGIRNAIKKLYGITDQKEILKFSESWKPYRSTACWYLWRSLENK